MPPICSQMDSSEIARGRSDPDSSWKQTQHSCRQYSGHSDKASEDQEQKFFGNDNSAHDICRCGASQGHYYPRCGVRAGFSRGSAVGSPPCPAQRSGLQL